MNEPIKAQARELLQSKKNRSAFFALASAVSLLFFSLSGFMAAEIVRVTAPPHLQPHLTALFAGILLTLWLFFSTGLQQYGCRLFAEGLHPTAEKNAPFTLRFLLKAIRLKTAIGLRRTAAFCGWMALPAGLTALLWESLTRHPLDKNATAPLWAGIVALFGISLVFFLRHGEGYLCAPYLLCRFPHLSVGQILRQSRTKAAGAEGALLRFQLGFWPWLFPCVLGVPLLFVIPYYKQSLACYIFTEE